MPTKEEMLTGIIKVNNERKNIEAAEECSKAKIPADDSRQADEPARKRSARRASAAPVVQGTEESLDEFLTRRAQECASEVESIDLDLECLEGRIKKLRTERLLFRAELDSIEKIMKGDV